MASTALIINNNNGTSCPSTQRHRKISSSSASNESNLELGERIQHGTISSNCGATSGSSCHAGGGSLPLGHQEITSNDYNTMSIELPSDKSNINTPVSESGADQRDAANTDAPLNKTDESEISNSQHSSVSAKSWNPLEEVDSALLSALCDFRERKALLRLEQVLLDFMKEKTLDYIEVGGAYNSLVIAEQAKHASNADGNKSGSSSPQISGMLQQSTVQDLQQQQQRGLRQTSFQRLILHRLADRFNIVRENSSSYQTNGPSISGNFYDSGSNGNFGQSTSYPPGLIRLVKVKESQIPTNLLVDMDFSLLINYKNPRARGGAGNPINTNSDEVLKTISDDFAAATALESSPGVVGSVKTKLNKKMIIMKRNSSGSGSSNNLEGINGRGGKREGRSRSGLKGKKLSDREKAYEEARARIFGVAESSAENEKSVEEDSCEKGEISSEMRSTNSRDDVARLSRSHSSFSSVSDGAMERFSPVPDVTAVVAPQPPAPQMSSAPEPQNDEKSSLVDTASNDPPRQPSPPISNASVPAAATAWAVSKAVYRNRQQEENDPDFKRRSDVRLPYNIVGSPNGVPGGNTPYVAPTFGNAAHVGYANISMGQPSASMVAIQSQQSHQSQYYREYAHQLATPTRPQDSAYPAQSQYFSSPQNYYNSQGHEKQSWHRLSSRQAQPTHYNGDCNPYSAQNACQGSWVVASKNESGDGGEASNEPKEVVSSEGASGGTEQSVYGPEDFPALR